MSEPRAGISVGHWTDEARRTGCTILLFDRQCAAVVDVRGGAPGTRETDLLASDRLVGRADAILLTGGSAFGLAAADGVMRFLHEQGRGFRTPEATVPIVPAAVIYDLGVGEAVWPAADDGYAACLNARPLVETKWGAHGVGTGATYRKLWAELPPIRGGIGVASVSVGDTNVIAIAIVNAVGDIADPSGSDRRVDLLSGTADGVRERTATTLVVLIIDGDCDERSLRRAATSAHDGMARAIVPCHTIWDGDLVFAVRNGSPEELEPARIVQLSVAAELAVEQAIRNSVNQPAP